MKLRLRTLALAIGLSCLGAPRPTRAETTYVEQADMERTQAAAAEVKAGLALIKQKDYAAGVPKIDAALDVLEYTLGPDHEYVAGQRNLLLQFYGEIWNRPADVARVNERAEKARAARANRPAPAQENPRLAQAQVILVQAMTAFSAQDFETAIRLFEQALPDLEPTLSANPSMRVQVDSILASLYDYSLRYDKAQALLEKTIRAVEEREGPTSPNLEIPLERLANHYMHTGEPARALPYLDRYVALIEKRAPGSIELSDAYRFRGDMRSGSDSGKQLDEALDDYQKALDLLDGHPFDASRMSLIADSVARVYQMRGDAEEYAKAMTQSCALGKGASTPQAVERSEGVCATAARLAGNWAEADRLLSAQADRLERTFGKGKSFFWQRAIHELALVRSAQGKKAEARDLLEASLTFEEDRMHKELLSGSDAQKRTKFGAYKSSLYDVLELRRSQPNDARLNHLAFETLLRRKGRALDAEAEAARAARLVDGDAERALLTRQREVRSLLTGLYLKGETSRESAGQVGDAVARLEAENDDLTRQLSEKSQLYGKLHQPVTVAAVQQKLDADTALVEFVAYIEHEPRTQYPVSLRYAAFVLTGAGDVQVVELGDALPILRASDDFREKILAKKPIQEEGRRLHGLLLSGVRKHLLPSVKRLLLAPDDELNLVPFAALVDERGRYLVQDFEVDYLSSGRDLLRFDLGLAPRSGPLVVGAPDFDANARGRADVELSGDLGKVRFPPLPGTLTEVEKVSSTLRGARLLTQGEATKAAIEAVDAPSVLHVATHGFFLAIDERNSNGTRGFTITSETPTAPQSPLASTENPLIRSGLAFAGANTPGSSSGILSALEAMTLRLDGTKLVVLSACETAVGTTDLGEGVYGLRRALVVAGSESQIMSLWKVDDSATRDLMIHVYESLEDGAGRGESVRRAQLELLSEKEFAHPYYWAAFIPSGNYRPMSFEVAQPSASSDGSSEGGAEEDPYIVTADGIRMFVFGRLSTLGNLLGQPDRMAGSLGFSLEFALLSGEREARKTGFAFHDAVVAEAEIGLRASSPFVYPDGLEENLLSAGYFVSYEAAFGYRARAFGLLGGLRPGFRGLSIGDVTHSGFLLPAFGLIELRTGDTLWALRGWYGSLFTDQETLGGSLDLSFDDDWALRLGIDQTKLSTAVGGLDSDDRVEVGRQVTTSYTIGFGGAW